MGKNKEPVWTTKDGREIPVKDMEDRHLLNAHRMVCNQAARCKETLDFGLSIFAPSPDTMAADDCDRIMDEAMDLLFVAKAWTGIFEEEIAHRGLTPLLHKTARPLPRVKSVEYFGGARIIELEH